MLKIRQIRLFRIRGMNTMREVWDIMFRDLNWLSPTWKRLVTMPKDLSKTMTSKSLHCLRYFIHRDLPPGATVRCPRRSSSRCLRKYPCRAWERSLDLRLNRARYRFPIGLCLLYMRPFWAWVERILWTLKLNMMMRALGSTQKRCNRPWIKRT